MQSVTQNFTADSHGALIRVYEEHWRRGHPDAEADAIFCATSEANDNTLVNRSGSPSGQLQDSR